MVFAVIEIEKGGLCNLSGLVGCPRNEEPQECVKLAVAAIKMLLTRLRQAHGIASVAHGVECLDRDGAVIFDQLANDTCMSELGRELPYLSQTPPDRDALLGRQTNRAGRLLLKSSTARVLAVHPWVLGVAESILGRHCSRIQISVTQAIRIEPGEKAQALHKDEDSYPIDKHGADFMLTAEWALTDFTRDNGAIRLVPGSHRPPTNSAGSQEICAAEMPSGSVLIYLGSLAHGSGANRTNAPCTGIVISYCLGWLRQAENQYLAYPPAAAKGFSRELQRLIGYAVHEPNLGWYEGQDPRVLLADDVPAYLSGQDDPLETVDTIE